jgi:hypothetical protein
MSAIPDVRRSAQQFEAVLEHAMRAELTGAQPQDSRQQGAVAGVGEKGSPTPEKKQIRAPDRCSEYRPNALA